MLKIEYSPFTLKPLQHGIGAGTNSSRIAPDRHGAVLKISWPGKGTGTAASAAVTGFSTLMPRAELKDEPLNQHLDNFKRGRISNLLEQSISFAKTDAHFRKLNKTAFEGAKKVRNNYFVPEVLKLDTKMMTLIKDQNFFTLMIDVGQDLAAEVDAIRKILKMTKFLVRLNFNAKTDWPSFERFMSIIEPGLKPRIEFVVDPLPYEEDSWKEASRFAPIAADSQLSYFDWENPKSLPKLKALFIRPTVNDAEVFAQKAIDMNCKIVVTSSFEHPIAVAHASLVASNLNTQYPQQVLDHDCLYQNYFAPHAFSSSIATQGPFISSTNGKGIGFTRQLEDLSWKSL